MFGGSIQNTTCGACWVRILFLWQQQTHWTGLSVFWWQYFQHPLYIYIYIYITFFFFLQMPSWVLTVKSVFSLYYGNDTCSYPGHFSGCLSCPVSLLPSGTFTLVKYTLWMDQNIPLIAETLHRQHNSLSSRVRGRSVWHCHTQRKPTTGSYLNFTHTLNTYLFGKINDMQMAAIC